MMALILGSASPRRAQLLAQLGVPFTRRAAHIDETPHGGEAPRDYVCRMARQKAGALAAAIAQAEAIREADTAAGSAPGAGDALLLTADTTVVIDDESLGKPADHDAARDMLARLSGRAHEVMTAVCLSTGGGVEECLVTTRVRFMALPDALLAAYLETDEPWDKAGAYAIQGLAGSFIEGVSGSVSNVIGLPLVETRALLARAGVRAGVGRACT